MLVIHGITIVMFIVLGIVLSCGKGSSLIAGYNTASPEKKGTYDEKALCRAVGHLMFVLALCVGVMALSNIFNSMTFLWLGLALFLIAGIGGAIYFGVSQKAKRK